MEDAAAGNAGFDIMAKKAEIFRGLSTTDWGPFVNSGLLDARDKDVILCYAGQPNEEVGEMLFTNPPGEVSWQ
eukprot:g1513.t1